MAYNVSHNLNFFTRIFTQFFALQIHDSFCFLKQIVCTLQSNNLPFFVVYYLLQQPTVELEDHLKRYSLYYVIAWQWNQRGRVTCKHAHPDSLVCSVVNYCLNKVDRGASGKTMTENYLTM
ncbi:uncharacterized protein LOC126706517 isoform X1 [Quercus robur]|uniref:uncharacterized protein LOC126706517 isoform X1 n=1 Tax=Quercus robur TaxID=38942 RepID=UPI002163157D|nr:uncharacterized protein LOC126706517 isoform X1 [Quercus robur]XP_050261981.1 uncharacterized protein LOC126706517 isoform X1 [Quercus robur]